MTMRRSRTSHTPVGSAPIDARWRANHLVQLPNVRASAAKALASRSFGFRLPPCLRRLQAPVRRLCHENVLRGGLDRRNSTQRREVASARTAPSTSLEVLLGEK